MHFSKSTALVVVGLEFFSACIGLMQVKSDFVVEESQQRLQQEELGETLLKVTETLLVC